MASGRLGTRAITCTCHGSRDQDFLKGVHQTQMRQGLLRHICCRGGQISTRAGRRHAGVCSQAFSPPLSRALHLARTLKLVLGRWQLLAKPDRSDSRQVAGGEPCSTTCRQFLHERRLAATFKLDIRNLSRQDLQLQQTKQSQQGQAFADQGVLNIL